MAWNCAGRPVPFSTGIWAGDYSGQAVLILQCAGETVSPGAEAEESNDGSSYLVGSAFNVAIVRNFYISKGLATKNLISYNFTGDMGELSPTDVIRDFLADTDGMHRTIYYTGHGCRDGRLAFHLAGQDRDEYISPDDMSTMLKESGSSSLLTVVLQSCFSGKWCYNTDFWVIASAPPNESSFTGSEGSPVTRYWYGKDAQNRFNLSRLGSQPMKNTF